MTDNRRRRRAAYCRGWGDLAASARAGLEKLWAQGLVSPVVYNALKAALDAAPPDDDCPEDTEPIKALPAPHPKDKGRIILRALAACLLASAIMTDVLMLPEWADAQMPQPDNRAVAHTIIWTEEPTQT